MRRTITTGLASFAIAGAALTSAVATAAPASANSFQPSSFQSGLVNIYADNLLNGNQVIVDPSVSIPVAAAICNVNANVLSTQLQNNQKGNCPALSTSKQFAWVAYN